MKAGSAAGGIARGSGRDGRRVRCSHVVPGGLHPVRQRTLERSSPFAREDRAEPFLPESPGLRCVAVLSRRIFRPPHPHPFNLSGRMWCSDPAHYRNRAAPADGNGAGGANNPSAGRDGEIRSRAEVRGDGRRRAAEETDTGESSTPTASFALHWAEWHFLKPLSGCCGGTGAVAWSWTCSPVLSFTRRVALRWPTDSAHALAHW